ncbi:hypothetical protein HGM15179_022228, partial [Zosterops borbonicus]
MSDGGAEPSGSPALLVAEPAAAGRAREKLPESALRTGGGIKDIPGTSELGTGSSSGKQRGPDAESPSGAGEADYCRRILVR